LEPIARLVGCEHLHRDAAELAAQLLDAEVEAVARFGAERSERS
jgi:hypothetical protein